MISVKDIRRVIDESADYILEDDELFVDEDLSGPCYHVKVRPEKDKIILLIDNKEFLKQSISKIGNISESFIQLIISHWKNGNIGEVHKMLRIE